MKDMYKCAFCSGGYNLFSTGNKSGAIHTRPECEAFRATAPDIFALLCRMAWQALRSRLPPPLQEN